MIFILQLMYEKWMQRCILRLQLFFMYLLMDSKINGTPKGVYLPISKLHSILTVTIYLHIITYGYVIMGK